MKLVYRFIPKLASTLSLVSALMILFLINPLPAADPSVARLWNEALLAATTIDCQFSPAAHVHLAIFNLARQTVATVVDERRPPGNYSITWDAAGKPAGTYFYQLQVNGKILNRRMLLLQ
jgi:hypothetical protein